MMKVRISAVGTGETLEEVRALLAGKSGIPPDLGLHDFVGGSVQFPFGELDEVTVGEIIRRGKSPGGCPPVFDAQRVPTGGRRRRPLRLGVVEGCFLFVLDSESGRDGIFDPRFYAGPFGVEFFAPTSA